MTQENMTKIEFIELNDFDKAVAQEISDLLQERYKKENVKALATLSFTLQHLEDIFGVLTSAIITTKKTP